MIQSLRMPFFPDAATQSYLSPETYRSKSLEMGNFGAFLSHLYTLAGYASVRAIESPDKLDDEQWLAYWILYSFLTLMEMVAEPILYWIPIWYQIKVAFVAWLVLPQFRGASFIYERFVREQLRKYGGKIGKGSAQPQHHIKAEKEVH
ncbi:protein HVA22-like isoform X2 [Typha angustifolia]|uniref:protein HVA22-like isoform X2 n=1 Tax=Typha angustifolia TaxID=59011 RepID=UPI003C2AB096